MAIALITGSAGLIGSECVRFFAEKGLQPIGIDNDMRRIFFGAEASTKWNRDHLLAEVEGYTHYNTDIRDRKELGKIFKEYNHEVKLIIHTAAQPSHDWAAREPFTDFEVNANGTLNLLEFTRQYCPEAVFLFTSTNKVYGDTPNHLPLAELEARWEIETGHPYEQGIDENMSIDQSTHSLMGVSKTVADLLVQEYGRYFGLKTACFRGGCLTGPNHSGTELHGFLAYLMKCVIRGMPYTVFGYKGKQVRDNIHSYDLVNMFWHFYQNPRIGEVYNAGGSRHCNCSMLEVIQKCEVIADKKLDSTYQPQNRIGDHTWWISDVRKFKSHYPQWDYVYDLDKLLREIYEALVDRGGTKPA